MNITSAFFVLLRDEYTPDVIQHNRDVINTFTDFVVIDERSDIARGILPAEKAIDKMVAELKEGYVKPADAPAKIEVKEVK